VEFRAMRGRLDDLDVRVCTQLLLYGLEHQQVIFDNDNSNGHSTFLR